MFVSPFDGTTDYTDDTDFSDRIYKTNRILPPRSQSGTEAVLAVDDLWILFPGFFSKRVSAIIPKKDSSRLSPARNHKRTTLRLAENNNALNSGKSPV
jgi:hypothetical protein